MTASVNAILCPSCKAPIYKVKPVCLPADPDSRRWQGPIPTALGFICTQCSVLLPLTAVDHPEVEAT
ncbi:MAG: hypothetical protein U1C74_17240 [Phenylobacterium sp.]|nr:hypothetical protein [Phenylobacterium sp.]